MLVTRSGSPQQYAPRCPGYYDNEELYNHSLDRVVYNFDIEFLECMYLESCESVCTALRLLQCMQVTLSKLLEPEF